MRNGWIGNRRQQQLGTLALARDATLRPGRGLVRVERGTVLATQEGDPEDHVLVAGMEFQPARRGAVVLWALEAARVTLAPAGVRVAPAAAAACAA